MELLGDAVKHMKQNEEYYGGLSEPLLHGSEEFRKRLGVGGRDYFGTLLISCDFSGKGIRIIPG